MDIRQLAPDFWVAPQIEPADMAALAAAGIRTVIDNRPDHEIPPALRAGEMRRAAETAGIAFVEVPAESRMMTPEVLEAQRSAMEAAAARGPTLAYCASGTRSSILWALARAGRMETDAILAATAGAGYALDGLRPQIEALATAGD